MDQPRRATTIARIVLRRLKLPLNQPYRLSYRTFHEFEPFLVEVVTADGQRAFGDGHVSPGSSAETREGAWVHLTARLPGLIGLEPGAAKARLLADFEDSKVATTAAVTALEALEATPLLDPPAASLPLLTPIGPTDPAAIEAAVEAALAAGYRTFKIKVGKDADADIARVGHIQRAAAGRATLRIDANRAYSRDDAIRFVRGISPEGVALFEQPCETEAWDDNAAVAAASDIPVMLDEPICTLADIERAARIPGVGFCKVKLKRFGSLDRLAEGIRAILDHGMGAVLGDGLGSDLHGWMEACVAARLGLDNAGEYNGFAKLTEGMLTAPLPFGHGVLTLPAGWRAEVDPARVERLTVAAAAF